MGVTKKGCGTYMVRNLLYFATVYYIVPFKNLTFEMNLHTFRAALNPAAVGLKRTDLRHTLISACLFSLTPSVVCHLWRRHNGILGRQGYLLLFIGRTQHHTRPIRKRTQLP